MYQALYRKYRPNNFNEVVGQNVIVKSFKNAINNNKLSHAYIFTGPRGTGKTTIAKILGKTVNCLNIIDALPCNDCSNCNHFNNREVIDIIEIDAASNNGVDEIRELKSKVNLVPSSGKYKVYIIDEVHMLTVGAFNALLKTLEEPPNHVIFILATTDPHKVPTTILSRCQRFDFKKISQTDLVNRLKYIANMESLVVDEGVHEEIARLSDGGCRDAISLLDQASAYSNDNITLDDIHDMNGTVSFIDLENIINHIFDRNIKSIFENFDTYNDQGKNLVKLTEEVVLFLRNILLYKTVPAYFENKDNNVQIYEKLKDKVNITQLLKMIELFNETIYRMKNSNSPKLLFELTIIKLTNIEKNAPSIITNNNKLSKNLNKKDDETEKVILSVENSKEKQHSADPNLKEKLMYVKKIRVDNTLSEFRKKSLLNIKSKFESFRPLILNSEYNEFVSLILDGDVKAASEEYLIIVFDKEWISDYFNENLLIIEVLFEEVYKIKYKIISVCIDEWDEIKNQFNTKKKEYIKCEETFELINILKQKEKKTDIESVFGNIVEYN